MSADRRRALWLLATVSGILSAWMTLRGIREIDLSPPDGLADPVGLTWTAMFAGVLLVLTLMTGGIAIGLGRSLPSLRRVTVFGLAATLIASVLVVLVLLQMSADRLTYV